VGQLSRRKAELRQTSGCTLAFAEKLTLTSTLSHNDADDSPEFAVLPSCPVDGHKTNIKGIYA
jgi:hypothetical protein